MRALIPLCFEELQQIWISVEVLSNGIGNLVVVHLL